MGANLFKNGNKADIGNSWTAVYTAPAGQASMCIELDVGLALLGTTGVQCSVRVHDVSQGIYTHLVRLSEVPMGSSLQVIDGQKVVLESLDSIEVICDTAGEKVDVTSSLIEDIN